MNLQRPQVPLLRTLEGLRLVSSIAIAAKHMLPHAGWVPPESVNVFVDLFFIISGIVIGTLYCGQIRGVGDWAQFMRRRLARIYPLHLATLLFYILIGAAIATSGLHVDDPSRFDSRQIVPNLLLIHAWFPRGRLSYNFVSWSISAEFFVYLAFPIIAFAVARRRAGILLVPILLAAALVIAERVMHQPLYLLVWDFGVIRAIPGFAFGIWLSRFGTDLPPGLQGRHARMIFHAAFALLLVGLALDLGYPLLALVYILVPAAYLTDIAALPSVLSWKPISNQGRLTYSIYMLHLPVTTLFVSFLFPRLFGASAAAAILSTVLGFIVLAVLAQLSFTRFENPLRKRLSGRSRA